VVIQLLLHFKYLRASNHQDQFVVTSMIRLTSVIDHFLKESPAFVIPRTCVECVALLFRNY